MNDQPEHERVEPMPPSIGHRYSPILRLRPKDVPLCAALSLLVLTGCSLAYPTNAPPSSGSPASFAPEPIFVDGQLLTIQRKYLDRYVCATKAPLLCDCGGRLTRLCLCRC